MAFLRNKTVNLLNAHTGLLALASRSGGVFVAVFLLRAGVSIPAVLCTYAAIFSGRFLLRPMVLVVGKRTGLRPLVMFGALMQCGQYLMLPHVHGIGAPLAAIIVIASISDAFYWTAYHAYFASLGDAEHRGHQISAREAVSAVIGVVAPIAGGFSLTTFGPLIAFSLTASLQAMTILPLFGAPNVPVAQSVERAFQASLPGFRLFMADGSIGAFNGMVWQLSLFGVLGHSFTAYGGAIAAAALLGAAAGLLLGRHIDAGHGGRAVWLAFAAVAITLLAKSAATTAVMAVAVNALAALIGSLYTPTLMTAIYNLSTRSPCSLRFQLAAEGGWDLGYICGSLTAAAAISLGAPPHWVIPLGLIGATANLVMLRRYYSASASVVAGDPAYGQTTT